MRLLLALCAVLVSSTAAAAPDGAALYGKYCLACHGAAGDGAGPAAAWLAPRPRDFTRGDAKWRTTPLDAAPAPGDLAHTVRYGAPGTSMPGFDGILTADELDAVVAVVEGFRTAPAGKRATAIAAPVPPAATAETAARGKALFATLGCAVCHGDGATGDGPGAANLQAHGRPNPPYDLTASPLRRPRAADDPDTVRAAMYLSITLGLAGTPMPGAAKGTAPADVWAIVDFLDSIRYRGARSPALSAQAIAFDKTDAVPPAAWPAKGPEAAIWGAPIAPQGEPPAALAPAQASLSSQQCARCHAKQAREWKGSLHAHATSPGLMAQIIRPSPDAPTWPDIESCQRCHAPLAEQLPKLRGTADDNPAYDAALRDEGITCASCHVRGWTRHGPPRVATSLVPVESYPLVTLDLYERSDFCMPCHQLPARTAVNGKPLLDTYREWLDGPYMPRGVQCQHCHMPNREHTWKGVHDPDTFRQGIAVAATATRGADRSIAARATLTNVGAGHMLPTTPTPAAWLTVELLDANGRPIAGTRQERRIGRHIRYTRKGWEELEDTRVAPGATFDVAATFPAAAAGAPPSSRSPCASTPTTTTRGSTRRTSAARSPTTRARSTRRRRDARRRPATRRIGPASRSVRARSR